MKKILKINAVIVILFSTILIFYSYKNKDSSYWMNWGQSKNSINIYLKNTGYLGSDLFNIISTLSKEINVNVIKTDYLMIDGTETIVKSVYINDATDNIFINDNLQNGQFISNEDNHLNKYISTKKSNDEFYKGKLFDFLDDDKVEIWTLERFLEERGSLDGDYIIRASNSESIKYFIDELSIRSGISKDDLLQQKTFVGVEEAPIETIAKIGIFISLSVFALLGIFYAIQKSKKIGVLKLNGFSSITIWFDLISPIFYWIILFTLLIDIIIVLFIKNNSMNFMVDVFKVELLVIVLLFLTSLFIYWIIKNNKISNLIKNKKTVKYVVFLAYSIKVVVFIILIAFIVFIGSGYKQANYELNKMKNWESVSDFAVLVNLETGEDAASIKQGDIVLDKDFANYYQFLENKGAIYTNVTEFVPHVQFKSKFNESTGTYDYVDYFNSNVVPQDYSVTTFQINKNYLKKYPLYDLNGNEIKVNNKDRCILIPESRKNEQKQLEELYKDAYIDSIKSSERRQGIETNRIPEVEIKSIIYKEDSNGYFTFSTDFENSNYLIYSPIFEVLSDDNMTIFEKSSSYIQGLDSPLKIDLKGATSKQLNENITSVLEKYNLEDNQLKYMTIGEVFSTQINSLKNLCRQYIIALIVAIAIMVLITMHLTRLLIESKKQKYCVQKLYGYSFMDRYKTLLCFGMIVNIVVSGFAMLLTTQLVEVEITELSMGLTLLLLVLDLFVVIILIKFFENKSVSQIVKGE